MDESEPIKEGYCATFGNAGARIEMPSCSLCMGNQAQVRERATIMSASTRNVPNRLSGQEHQGVPGFGRTGGGVIQARPRPDRGRVSAGGGHHQHNIRQPRHPGGPTI
jgi:hypothetical protein